MKLKYLAIGLMMLFCMNVIGQQQKTVSMTVQPQKTEVQILEETVAQLQAENQDMQKQLESIEKEVELYRGDVRADTSKMNTNMALWFSVLTIVMAILGVAIPLILNKKNERIVEKLLADAKQEAVSAKEQAEKAEEALNSIQPQVEAVKEQVVSAAEQAKQAKQAVADIGELRTHVDTIEKKINEDALAVEKASKEVQANRLFTQAYSEKDSSKAIALYTKAIELNPDFAAAYNNRGILLSELKDFAGAMSNYNKAIELNPNDADAYVNRGILKSSMGDDEKAIIDYDRAIELAPDDYAAYNNRACSFLLLGKLDKAFEDVSMALNKNKNDSYSYDTRGQIYMAMGENDQALEDFNRALSINNVLYEAYVNRAKCYRKLAESEKDPTKKAELIAKAEADEKKAESLK